MHLGRRLAALCLTLWLLAACGQHSYAASKQQPGAARAGQGRCGQFEVMTRNLYLGTDFSEIFAAQETPTLLAEVAEAFADVQAGDPQARIKAVAHEIRTARPDLVSLQEVALWQTGPFDPLQPSANTVAYDYLQLLLEELNKNGGVHYEPVAVLTNLVAEAPAAGPEGLFDVRFTDRVAVLARTDLKKKQFGVDNIVAQHFSALLSVPTPALGQITIPRGYISADVERCGRSFRFVAAHLESFHPAFTFLQANELLAGPLQTALPVVLAGDLNTDAEGDVTSAAPYHLLINSGFSDAWDAASPDEPGLTWPLFLGSPFAYTQPTQRLDLVLTRGAVEVMKAELIGERDVTPQGPMPSDHAGVAATLGLLP